VEEYLDISFTVKESELMGRKLVRDLKTGQIRWLGESVDIPPDMIVEENIEEIELLPVVTKSVTKRKKAQHAA